MSEQTASPPVMQNQGGARGAEYIIFAVIGAVVIGLIWLFSGKEDPRLHQSATGFDGVVSWYRAQEIEARSFTGGGRLVQGKVGLRILPVFDTDLDEQRVPPETREAVIAQTSEADLYRWIVYRKVKLLPTLVVLPKWRTGMRRLGVAHRSLLIPEQEINRLVGQITGDPDARLRRDPQGYRTGKWQGEMGQAQEIGLVHAQALRGIDCVPIIGNKDAMLLAECPLPRPKDEEPDAKDEDNDEEANPLPQFEITDYREHEETFLLLADPDLLNNHGLKLAQNAQLATAIARRFDTSQPIILDKTNFVATVDEDWQSRQHERKWEDFARMFRWPFTMIWIAFGFLGALVLWRAVTRYGPLARAYDEEPRASKEISIAAKARLLRLANHDVALLASHIRARLAHLAAELLGPHRPVDRDPLMILTQLIERRSPELADELRAASALPKTATISPAEVLRRLDRFENCYDRVTHEFGRASTTG